MRDGPREVTLSRAWTPRRTKELHLRPAGFLCCAEGASIDFVNGLLDAELHHRLATHWTELKSGLVEVVDTGFKVFDGTTFKEDRFAALLLRTPFPGRAIHLAAWCWITTTFKEQAKTHPTLHPLHELRRTLSLMRLTDLAVGSDGRNRCLLSPFASVTGRNQPSNAKFVFGAAKWLRGLIRPPEGYGLAYLDWSAQEFAVAAALSGDERMITDYAAGDPHIGFAKTARLVPPDATKETHPLIRERCKTTNLGVLYGMKARGLAGRLGITVPDAEELLACTAALIDGSGVGLKRWCRPRCCDAKSLRRSGGACVRPRQLR